jgi:hypothetical protein
MGTLVLNKMNILGYRGESPVIECYRYSEHVWYFYCELCKKFHYHSPSNGLFRARCQTGKFVSSGYYLKLGEYEIRDWVR